MTSELEKLRHVRAQVAEIMKEAGLDYALFVPASVGGTIFLRLEDYEPPATLIKDVHDICRNILRSRMYGPSDFARGVAHGKKVAELEAAPKCRYCGYKITKEREGSAGFITCPETFDDTCYVRCRVCTVDIEAAEVISRNGAQFCRDCDKENTHGG